MGSSSKDSKADKKVVKPVESDSESGSSDNEVKSGSESGSESGSDSESEDENKSLKRKNEDDDETPKRAKVEEPVEEEKFTIFVGGLAWAVDDDRLRSEFEHIGQVISARVITDRDSGRSKGYGYVDFETKQAAEDAVEKMRGAEIEGRSVNVDMSQGKKKPADRAARFGDVPSNPSDTLFVGNLPFDVDQNEVQDLFSQYGTVLSVRLPTHPDTQQPKGFGYVQMGSVDDAKAAFEKLASHPINGRPIRLDYSTPRDPSSGGRGGFGGRGGRGGFNDRRGGFGGRGGNRGGFGGRGGRGGRGGFNDRRGGDFGGSRGGFQGKRTTF